MLEGEAGAQAKIRRRAVFSQRRSGGSCDIRVVDFAGRREFELQFRSRRLEHAGERFDGVCIFPRKHRRRQTCERHQRFASACDATQQLDARLQLLLGRGLLEDHTERLGHLFAPGPFLGQRQDGELLPGDDVMHLVAERSDAGQRSRDIPKLV